MYDVEIKNNTFDLLNAETGEVLASCHREKPYELLEFVGGKMEDMFSKYDARIEDEVRNAFIDARYRFMEDFPDRDCPPLTYRRDTEYVYLYSSITNPNRVAGVTKRKYADLLRKRITELVEGSDPYIWLVFHTEKIKEVGMMSWLKMGYVQMSMADFSEGWLRDNGVMLKPGKAVRNMTEDGIDISVFAGYFQDEMNKLDPNQCEILISDTPSEVYIKGGNFTSCMRKDDPEFFRIYDDVEACSIAYIVENKELKARALLWKDVEDLDTGERYNVMDRIYSENHKYLSAMILWATTHGYLHKTAQALNVNTYYKPDLSVITLKNAKVETNFAFEYEMYDLVPYVDTFQWVFCEKSGMYTTDLYASSVCLTDTEGSGDWLTRPRTTCTYCGYPVDEDQAFFDNNDEAWCNSCLDRHWTRCEECGEYVRNNEIYEVSLNGEPRTYVCETCLEDYWHEEYTDAYWDRDHSFRATDKNGDELWISRERFEDEGVWFECAECNGIFHESFLDKEMHETCNECGDNIRFRKSLEETA